MPQHTAAGQRSTSVSIFCQNVHFVTEGTTNVARARSRAAQSVTTPSGAPTDGVVAAFLVAGGEVSPTAGWRVDPSAEGGGGWMWDATHVEPRHFTRI